MSENQKIVIYCRKFMSVHGFHETNIFYKLNVSVEPALTLNVSKNPIIFKLALSKIFNALNIKSRLSNSASKRTNSRLLLDTFMVVN
uniref:Uncharacterized protein n=1 Tax=Romanomermis culicivorax TaxID=13658 RepID=A0A915IMP8_ROMCU